MFVERLEKTPMFHIIEDYTDGGGNIVRMWLENRSMAEYFHGRNMSKLNKRLLGRGAAQHPLC